MTNATSEAIQAIAAGIVAFTAIASVLLAWRGLKAWRQELRGRAEYELARQILTGVYSVRDAVSALRHAVVTPSEWIDRPGHDSKNPGNADDMTFAYGRRWNNVLERRRALDADLLAAEALWDEKLRELANAMDGQLRTLYFHIFARYMRSLRDEHYRRAIEKDWDKTERVIWAEIDPEAGDEFGDEFAAIVRRFDAVLKVHLRR